MAIGGYKFSLPEDHRRCVLCGRGVITLVMNDKMSLVLGICEPCARIADWQFRAADDAELAGVPFPTVSGASLVLIVRERVVDGHPDTTSPFDVLMVERKDEPGRYGLPGGKREEGEDAREAAVRELLEETMVVTWPTALESLYTGFSPRGRLVETFLCRAYGGQPSLVEGEGSFIWQPWPPSPAVGAMRGYYAGMETAFDLRARLRKAMQSDQPLSQHLGRSALMYIALMLNPEDSDDWRQHCEGMSYVMTDAERVAAKIVLSTMLAPKAPEAAQADEEEPAARASEDEPQDAEFEDTEGREGPPR